MSGVVRHSLVVAAAFVVAWCSIHVLLFAFDNAGARVVMMGTLVVAGGGGGVLATRLTPPKTPGGARAVVRRRPLRRLPRAWHLRLGLLQHRPRGHAVRLLRRLRRRVRRRESHRPREARAVII